MEPVYTNYPGMRPNLEIPLLLFSLEDVQQLWVGVYIMFVEVILPNIEQAVTVIIWVSPDEEKKQDRREVATFNQEKGSAQRHPVFVLATAVVHYDGHQTTKFVFFQCPNIPWHFK
jgi:hypothetical protein